MKKKSPISPSHLFGPVISRRLNISLGIDLIPYKTCTLNCIYCESGKTTDIRVTRKGFVDPQIILGEVKEYLEGNDYPLDFVTFSGSGEPTLSSDLGYLIKEIRKMTNTPLAVLTNSTLISLPDVRDDLAQADLVIPSVDAVDEKIFLKINQPHPRLNIQKIKAGLQEFAHHYKGRLWVEVFLVKGVNDHPLHLKSLYEFLKTLTLEKIQLNSLDRPPAYQGVRSLSIKELEVIKSSWNDLRVEIIKRTNKREEIVSFCKNLENSILNTIIRRPLTVIDLMNFTGKEEEELKQYLDLLIRENKIIPKIIKGQIFYCPNY